MVAKHFRMSPEQVVSVFFLLDFLLDSTSETSCKREAKASYKEPHMTACSGSEYKLLTIS